MKYRKINFLLFILANVIEMNIKLLISIMNQITIRLVRVRGTMDDRIIMGKMHMFKNKLIINLFKV